MLEVVVRDSGGCPTLLLNGEPANGIIHWNRWPEALDAASFRKAGIDILSFMGNVWLGEEHDGHSPELQGVSDGRMPAWTLSPSVIDRVMAELIGGNPDLLVLPRVRLLPPNWWKEQHPDELMLHYGVESGRYLRGRWPAIGSRLWLGAAMGGLARTVEHFESRWGDRVIGYHSGFGDCAEHSYQWGWPERVISDYSQPHTEGFRDWLRVKYGSVEALREAWRQTDATFEDAAVPPPERRIRSGRGVCLCDPETEMAVVDYHTYHSDAMAESVVCQARTVKSTLARLGRTKVFGAFYAYHNFSANEPQTHYNAGHDAHGTVLACPDIDFLCCPLGYGARQSGGLISQQLLVGSLKAHGKLYYGEDDTGTHLAAPHHHGYVPRTRSIATQVHRRNFLDVWSSGGTLWWMDLHGKGWFRDDGVLREFAALRQFADDTLDNRRSVAQIAVFASDESMRYLKFDHANALSGALLERQRQEICAVGAPYDMFRVEDIELLARRDMLAQYRFCIFADTLAISEGNRAAIRQHLARDGRTLLWLYAPGIVRDGKWDAEAASELTGIDLHLVRGQERAALTVETWLDGGRLVYGSERSLFPRLVGNDPDAEPMGFYVEGTRLVSPDLARGDAPALMAKDMPGWRSIWSGAPAVPARLLAGFAGQAGVHVYAPRGDQVFVGPGWLGLHAKVDGPLEIVLPSPRRVVDCLTGGTLHQHTRAFRIETRRGETRLFELG